MSSSPHPYAFSVQFHIPVPFFSRNREEDRDDPEAAPAFSPHWHRKMCKEPCQDEKQFPFLLHLLQESQ